MPPLYGTGIHHWLPPQSRVTLAAPSLTTGGKGLPRVEVSIRYSVFAGAITDAQAVDLADDPALTIGQRLTIANKTRRTPVLL